MPIYKGKCRNLGWCDAALDGADVEVQASGPADARCPQCGEPLELVRPPASYPYPVPHPVPPPQSAWGRMAAAMAAGLLLGGAGLAYAGRWQRAGANAPDAQAVAQPFVRDSAVRVSSAVPVDSAMGGVVTSTFADAKQFGGPGAPKLPDLPDGGYPPPGGGQAPGGQDEPPSDAEPAVALPLDTTITVRPESAYCASQMRRGRNLAFVLADALPLPAGGSLPPGTPVTGQVTSRDVGSAPDDPDRLQVELTSIEAAGASVGIITSPLAVEMKRDHSAATGTVLRYGLIGAVAGASVAVLLRRRVIPGALFGFGGGAVLGGLRAATADPCFVSKETLLPFHLVAQADISSP